MSDTGVREMGVSEARANMTDVIAEARLLDVDFVLTRRDKPQAVLISVKRYEQAKKDRALIRLLKQRAEEGMAGDTADVRLKGEALHVALLNAELQLDDD